jgi:hypothetical protein
MSLMGRSRRFRDAGTCRFGDAATSARGNWFFEPLLPIVVTRSATTWPPLIGAIFLCGVTKLLTANLARRPNRR